MCPITTRNRRLARVLDRGPGRYPCWFTRMGEWSDECHSCEWHKGFDRPEVVAHLISAIAAIAGHVANTSDKVVDLIFLELDEAGHCVQRALLALGAFSHIAGLRSGWPPSLGALNVSLGGATLSFSTSALPNCLASSIGWEPEGSEEER